MKIGVFVIPCDELRESIRIKKSKVIKSFDHNQPYVLHPIHLTLFTLEIVDSNTSELSEILKLELADFKKFYIKTKNNLIFENDLLTGGHTVAIGLEKSKELSLLQLKLIRSINKSSLIVKSAINANMPKWYNDNLQKYGFPFVGDVWIPHITIASLLNCKKDDNRIAQLLDKNSEYLSLVNSVSLWHIEGEEHEKISDLRLG